ncbi:MAG: helix-turn-helix domain-containing protein [Thermoguttaceae bacterium]
MTRKRCTGKALAERRRRAMQLHLAGFTQEEIAEKLGVYRSVVSCDLHGSAIPVAPGNPPTSRRRASYRTRLNVIPTRSASEGRKQFPR